MDILSENVGRHKVFRLFFSLFPLVDIPVQRQDTASRVEGLDGNLSFRAISSLS